MTSLNRNKINIRYSKFNKYLSKCYKFTEHYTIIATPNQVLNRHFLSETIKNIKFYHAVLAHIKRNKNCLKNITESDLLNTLSLGNVEQCSGKETSSFHTSSE